MICQVSAAKKEQQQEREHKHAPKHEGRHGLGHHLGDQLVERGRHLLQRQLSSLETRLGGARLGSVAHLARRLRAEVGAESPEAAPARASEAKSRWSRIGAKVVGPIRFRLRFAAHVDEKRENAATIIQRHVRGLDARRRLATARLRGHGLGGGLGGGASLLRHVSTSKLTHMVLDTAFDRLGFSDERKAVFARDFEISNLDYKSLFAKTVQRSYVFFAVGAVFQLFAILPRYGLNGQGDEPARTLSWLHLATNHSGPPDSCHR